MKETTTSLDATIDQITARTALLEERFRAQRLARFDPPPRRYTVDEMQAEAERLRAENDAIEVERIPLA